jgi:hypothetical protein
MELKEYIGMEFDGLERNIKRVTDGLTREELMWRPACGCNSMGLILFHVARSEDSLVQARLRSKPEVWDTGKWYKKLNVAKDEAGSHYTAEQVNAFTAPQLEDILAYYTAVHAQIMKYVKTLTAASFEKKITMPHFGDLPMAAMFSLVVSHTAGHIGEISYLRGLQRGMDK